MSDSIVTVRLPESLMEALRQTASQEHFMDLSEAVRDIIKKKTAEYYGSDNRDQIIAGLQNLLQQLKHEARQEE